MKRIMGMVAATLTLACGSIATSGEVPMDGFYDIEVKTISGETLKLEHYKGKVLLLVNTASKCGFTGQYEGLQKLYETYREKGFVVLGFPSNDFLKQEPGTDEEIQSFCTLNYGVSFPMFSKISVKGKEQHPLYRYLTSEETNPDYSGKISWNFNKFLISAEGQVIGRYGSRTKPEDKELVAAIESALEKK